MGGFTRGFQTQASEIDIAALPLRGSMPEWLSGSLVRVTPAQFDVGDDQYRHWFDGLAMLHRFAFDSGKVGYINRYLQTPAYRENNAAGQIKYSEFATDPCRKLFSRCRRKARASRSSTRTPDRS